MTKRSSSPNTLSTAAWTLPVLRDSPLEFSMADNLKQRGGQDRSRINVKQDYEVRDWAKKFGVSPEELKKAVLAVGDRADKVEAHLKGKSSSPS
jgi:Protein of unknown function (DUF3606)